MDIDVAAGTITFRILYAGPESATKAANLRGLHASARDDERGELTVLHAGPDRVFSFPYSPREHAGLSGFRVVFQAMTLPGRLANRATERLLVAAADAVIFIPDRRDPLGQDTRRAYATVAAAVQHQGAERPPVPVVLQCYRDLEARIDAASLGESAPPGLVEIATGNDTIESVQTVFQAASTAVVERWREVETRHGPDAARKLAAERTRLPLSAVPTPARIRPSGRRRVDQRWLAVAALGVISGVVAALLLAKL